MLKCLTNLNITKQFIFCIFTGLFNFRMNARTRKVVIWTKNRYPVVI